MLPVLYRPKTHTQQPEKIHGEQVEVVKKGVAGRVMMATCSTCFADKQIQGAPTGVIRGRNYPGPRAMVGEA
jgi:hypothetical protein